MDASERREAERVYRRWRSLLARHSLERRRKNRKRKKLAIRFFFLPAATRSTCSQLSFSPSRHSTLTLNNSTNCAKKRKQKQIFSELANLGPVVPSSEEANNGRGGGGGQLVTGVFPFRTSDDVVEPHPGLRAYPFLGQVTRWIERERERERERARESRKARTFFNRGGAHGDDLFLFVLAFRPSLCISAFPASVAKLLQPSR